VARRLSSRLLTAAVLLVLPARLSFAQAYIPAAGDGTVSVAFQSVHSSAQLDSKGQEGVPVEDWDNQSLISHVEYGVTDKFAVHASLPFMMTRYKGWNPHSDYDDGTYHSTFQDFYFGMRYGVVQSPGFALAPFVEVVIPSHSYPSQVQSAPGRDVRVVNVGTAVGGFLDNVLPGLYFQSRIRTGSHRRSSTFTRIEPASTAPLGISLTLGLRFSSCRRCSTPTAGCGPSSIQTLVLTSRVGGKSRTSTGRIMTGCFGDACSLSAAE
jgi:hypothetical protein